MTTNTVVGIPGGAFAAMGEQLLHDFGTAAFEQVQRWAGVVLQHHLDDTGGPAATLGSRAAVLARAFRKRDYQRLADALGIQD